MSLDEIQRQLGARDVANGVAAHRFANARLMSPQDVALATRSRTPEDQSAVSGWWICGDVHPGMWTAVRDGALFAPLCRQREVGGRGRQIDAGHRRRQRAKRNTFFRHTPKLHPAGHFCRRSCCKGISQTT